MEFNLFASPSSYRRNHGPWKMQDVVSRLMKPMQPHDDRMDFTLSLDSPPPEENLIPRIDGHCDMCLANETPLWRGGPNGPKTLCNACGLRYSKELKKVKLALGEKPKARKKAQGGENSTFEDDPLANIALGEEPSADLALGGEPSAKLALGEIFSAGPKTKKAEKKKSTPKK